MLELDKDLSGDVSADELLERVLRRTALVFTDVNSYKKGEKSKLAGMNGFRVH